MLTEALDVREIDSSDWFRFFFSGLVVVLFKMPLSSGFVNELLAVSIASLNVASLKYMIQDKTNYLKNVQSRSKVSETRRRDSPTLANCRKITFSRKKCPNS